MCAELFAQFLFKCGDLLFVQFLQLRRINVYNRRAAADHDAVEFVEIFLTDWIKFVIMAARAGNRDAENSLGNHIDLVVSESDLLVVSVGDTEAVRHHAQVRRADSGFVEVELLVNTRLFDEVAGEMFADELIVGDVGIDCSDNVVAVLRRVGNVWVALAAV